jgi:hypothetical protein
MIGSSGTIYFSGNLKDRDYRRGAYSRRFAVWPRISNTAVPVLAFLRHPVRFCPSEQSDSAAGLLKRSWYFTKWSGARWEYREVIVDVVWPRILCRSNRLPPAATKAEANEWRKP